MAAWTVSEGRNSDGWLCEQYPKGELLMDDCGDSIRKANFPYDPRRQQAKGKKLLFAIVYGERTKTPDDDYSVKGRKEQGLDRKFGRQPGRAVYSR